MSRSPTVPIPRVPGFPDPLRRARVPKDLESVTTRARHREVDPRDVGMDPAEVEGIWDAALGLYRTGVHPALSLCVRRHGQVVLDRAVGYAKGGGPGDASDEPKVLATPDTPMLIFSAAKAVTATLVHKLDELGLLHVEDRVAEYVPEYAAHGKHRITIDHVLSHRAGVPNLPPEVLDLDHLGDRDVLVRAICEARPTARPGRLLSYHAISGGFILGEVIGRVAGVPVEEALKQHLLEPLGFRWGRYGVEPDEVDLVARNYATGAPVLPPLSSVLTRAFGIPTDEVTRLSNDPRFLTGVLPAANVVTTANELGRFFDVLRNGGELDGVRVLEPRTIRRATVERAYRELDLTLGAPMRHSAGFMLGAKTLSLFGPDTEFAFGHLGFTNVLGWADPERDVSVGFITTGKPVVHHGLPDIRVLTQRIGRAAPKVEHPVLALKA